MVRRGRTTSIDPPNMFPMEPNVWKREKPSESMLLLSVLEELEVFSLLWILDVPGLKSDNSHEFSDSTCSCLNLLQAAQDLLFAPSAGFAQALHSADWEIDCQFNICFGCALAAYLAAFPILRVFSIWEVGGVFFPPFSECSQSMHSSHNLFCN